MQILCTSVDRTTGVLGLPGSEEAVMEKRSFVSVVDDDESVRESLPDLLGALGYPAKAFASAEEYLASDCIGDTCCLILDIAMPGLSGPELREALLLKGHNIPTIFITAQAGKNSRQRLVQQGAVACLLKPFSEQELDAAVRAALAGA